MRSKLSRHHRCLGLVMAALVANVSTVASAQPFKRTTPIAPGVATPDRLETSIGTLNLIDGVPKPDALPSLRHLPNLGANACLD